jgi:hypothetical protein
MCRGAVCAGVTNSGAAVVREQSDKRDCGKTRLCWLVRVMGHLC